MKRQIIEKFSETFNTTVSREIILPAEPIVRKMKSQTVPVEEPPYEPLKNLEPKSFTFSVVHGNNAALITRVMTETFRNKFWVQQNESSISYSK